jgi:hypothetical protein
VCDVQMDLDVGSNPRIAVKIPNIKERRPAMGSGWWMTDLLGLQDHVALSSTRSIEDIRRPNHSASSFMSSSSCALHSSFISLWYAQVTKVELRRTYGYELADIWWGASRVSGSGNLRLQEGSITLGQFLHP